MVNNAYFKNLQTNILTTRSVSIGVVTVCCWLFCLLCCCRCRLWGCYQEQDCPCSRCLGCCWCYVASIIIVVIVLLLPMLMLSLYCCFLAVHYSMRVFLDVPVIAVVITIGYY